MNEVYVEAVEAYLDVLPRHLSGGRPRNCYHSREMSSFTPVNTERYTVKYSTNGSVYIPHDDSFRIIQLFDGMYSTQNSCKMLNTIKI
jgi:hypothetical protein